MGNISEIFDMFSNDEDDNQARKKRKNENYEETSTADTKSIIMNKLVNNKPLLITTVVIGVAVVGGIAYIIINFIGKNGITAIINGIKPFIGN
jgi:hypothetical protein